MIDGLYVVLGFCFISGIMYPINSLILNSIGDKYLGLLVIVKYIIVYALSKQFKTSSIEAEIVYNIIFGGELGFIFTFRIKYIKSFIKKIKSFFIFR